MILPMNQAAHRERNIFAGSNPSKLGRPNTKAGAEALESASLRWAQ
jgi:hypothetical protein